MSMTKKGYTLIEVAIASSLLSLFFMTVISIELTTVKIRAKDKRIETVIKYMDALKISITNEVKYEDVNKMYDDGYVYINEGNIDINKLKNEPMQRLFESVSDSGEAYIKMDVSAENPAEIILNYHGGAAEDNEIITCRFYKGNY